MFDACHVLTLCRNALADKRVIESQSGKKVELKFFERHESFQTKEVLKLANKLSANHIFHKNRKMNVKLAAQTLSASVAEALQFLVKTKLPKAVKKL